MFRFLFILFISCTYHLEVQSRALSDDQSLVQTILDDLYKANGNYIYTKPSILVTTDNSSAALYMKRANKIEISQKLISTCLSLNERGKDALAFVIGHELSHAYQSDFSSATTSFLAYDKHHHEGKHWEESADVQGAFMTYLAGYHSIDILQSLMDRIYDDFNLEDQLKNYPSLDERKETSKKVSKMVVDLIDVFETANYLTSIGKHELAVGCYSYIKNWYQGKEIYNNLGVANILQALNFSDENLEGYLYPLELDWKTRMDKPIVNRGDEDEKLKQIRDYYLDQAIENLQVASKMDPLDVTADLNILCATIIRDGGEAGLNLYKQIGLKDRVNLSKTSHLDAAKLDLLLAIAFAKNHDNLKANDMFVQASNSKITSIARQSDYNVKVMKGFDCEIDDQTTCEDQSYAVNTVDGIRLHRVSSPDSPIKLTERNNTTLGIQTLPSSKLYVFQSDLGKFVLQRGTHNQNEIVESAQVVMTDEGNIVHCPTEKTCARVDDKDQVLEWVKYY